MLESSGSGAISPTGSALRVKLALALITVALRAAAPEKVLGRRSLAEYLESAQKIEIKN